MRHIFLNLALVFIAVVATVIPAWAAEMTDFQIENQEKKIRLIFKFSDTAAYSTVSDFNSNILVLNYEGLKLSDKQRSKDHRLEGDIDYDVLRFVRFQNTGEQAEIRIYLGWEVNPADAQVVAFDDRIEVDILKPMHLATPSESPSVGGGEWEIQRDPAPGETEDDAEGDVEGDAVPEPDPVAITPEPVEADENDGLDMGSLRQPFFPELEGNDETGETRPDTDKTEGDEIPDSTEEAPAIVDDSTPSSDFRPAREFTSTPSYKKFDLDEVEVNQLEFRSVPFNEVLLDLVAGSGFNVVVGEGIDNKELTLSFTKKKMSLKSALYILCTAYDLEYTVEDDAIIIRAKD